MDTTSAAAATPAPEGFTDAEWEKFERFQAEKERRRIAAERVKAGLTTEKLLLRNETGNPLSLPLGCSIDAHNPEEKIRCDASDPACRLRASKPLAAPEELFWVPAGHRKGVLVNPALSEVDPGSVEDEPAAQDRLLLEELRAFEQRAQAPANQAARTLQDLEAQKRILIEKIAEQEAELNRRRSHVEAAKAKSEEFLSSRSEAWREALLGGAPEAALEAARRAADEVERRRPEIHTTDDLRRAQSGETRTTAFKMGANGPEPLPVRHS